MKKYLALVLCVVLLSSILGGCASNPDLDKQSANWPEKKVQVVIPYNTGGAIDIIARSWAAQSSLPIVITNMPGAGGLTATGYVKDSDPDGYTLLTYFPESMITAYYNGTSEIYPTDLDLASTFGKDYSTLSVSANDDRFSTWEEFVAYAKDYPGKLNVAGSGSKNTSSTIVEMVSKEFGIDLNWVPYDSTNNVRAAVLGGHADACANMHVESVNMTASGDYKTLWIAADERIDALPEVPTLKELMGGKDLTFGTLRCVLAPKGTPQEILDLIAKDIDTVCASPEFKAAVYDKVGLIPKTVHNSEYEDYVKKLDDVFRPILKGDK